MIGITFAALVLAAFLWMIALWPIFVFMWDPKGLRKFPLMHPLAGVYNLPFILESLRGFRSEALLKLHQKGNPVIRIGPNSLSYGTVAAIKAIYGHNTSTTKDSQYIEASGTHFHLADVVDKKEHARKRKVLALAFAAKYLEGWEYKVSDKVARLITRFDEHINNKSDAPLDYRAWTNFYTIDTLSDICVSEHTRCIERGNDTVIAEDIAGNKVEVQWRKCLYATFHVVGDLVWSYEYYKLVAKVVGSIVPFYSRLFALSAGWTNIVHHLTKNRWERYARGEGVNDLFSALMDDSKGNAHNLEWGEVVAEVSLMISGSSSTSNSIASTMQLLMQNPLCLKKLQEEVDSSMRHDELLADYDKTKHLPYLRAVIDESLRLYPSISHGLPRETPAEGAQILNDWIPGKTTVSISAYVAHRDPEVFPDPESFAPERWLGEEGKSLQPYFIAFSAGARGCIGKPISYLMSTVLLATLVHRYDFAMFYSDWKPYRRETMNLILGEVPVKITRRKHSLQG